MSKGSRPTITAVVCTQNRAHLLRRALTSLTKQTLPREAYSALVVDNASTDATADVAREFFETHGMNYVYEPRLGVSHARNRALIETEAEIVAYLDDDAVAEPGWLEALLAVFSRETRRPMCAGGKITLDWEAPRPRWLPDAWLSSLGALDYGEVARECRFPEEPLFGANMAFERQFLLDAGGFNPNLGRRGRGMLSNEETSLMRRVSSEGGVLFYEPRAAVSHRAHRDRLTFSWFLRRTYGQGVSDELLDELEGGNEWPAGTSAVGFARRLWAAARIHPGQAAFLGLMSAAYHSGRLMRRLRVVRVR